VSGGTLSRVMSVMQSSLKVYGSHHLMGNISGNHDKPRFMALASGDLVPGEDSHAAGWTREIGITDSTAYDRLALFHAFNMTIPGVPVIYYGDEIGMTGGNDPDCRRMMYFDGWNVRERGLFDRVSALAHLRTDNMAMMYGDFISLENTDETWVYARKYFDSEAVVLLNNGSEPKTFDVALNGLDGEGLKALVGESEFSVESGRLKITLPALSYEVLYR
ncbi:MAG: alpha-glucosidase C-terminal domain-containing protein, partial [bacterium]|nr:alpha-glucosidase C-terminal domain-containing protein [Candidatus Aphodosoma intestinipullorum]